MARPKNKEALLEQSQQNYQQLLKYIDALPPEKHHADFVGETMNRNVRDVLAHIHHWHSMMLEWHRVGMAGDKPSMPAEGYTWKTVPDLNRAIWQHYQQTELSEIRAKLQQSFAEVQALMQAHSDEELFTKKYYHWTGSTSLGSYLISASSSHYAWAHKLIKKGLPVSS